MESEAQCCHWWCQTFIQEVIKTKQHCSCSFQAIYLRSVTAPLLLTWKQQIRSCRKNVARCGNNYSLCWAKAGFPPPSLDSVTANQRETVNHTAVIRNESEIMEEESWALTLFTWLPRRWDPHNELYMKKSFKWCNDVLMWSASTREILLNVNKRLFGEDKGEAVPIPKC